jgi:hypothetical protein
MRLGMHMRELWEHKLGFAIALAIALLAAARTQGASLSPPGFERSAEDGRAATHLLVDTPQSLTVDLRQSTYDIGGLIDQTLLVSNATAGIAVRERIAAKAGLPANAIKIETSLSAQYPVAVTEEGGPLGAEEPLRAPYRIGIQANPTVPLIDINAQAPTEGAAVKLADAAAAGFRSYLASLARGHATPPGSRIELVRLGRAQPLATDSGTGPIATLLIFGLVFAAASATVLFVTRVRRGWRAGDDGLDTHRAPPVRP